MSAGFEIRLLGTDDAGAISAAFMQAGIIKTLKRFEEYLSQQERGVRICFVATADAMLVGYLTVNWTPAYPPFANAQIPEIQDLNVLPAFRRRGCATLLLDRAEAEIACRSRIAGIGVGLHPGYNQAQRLYVKRGYIPDGQGITYQNKFVSEGTKVVLDDDLLLHMTKQLKGTHA
jgi:GNAT superfamily N-acetyltransferase